MKEISTTILSELTNRPGVRVIDVRRPDAYHGWALRGGPRGGHICGAKSFPAGWLNYMDWIEMARRKNILEKDDLILYGEDREETEAVAKIVESAGYSNVRVYHRFPDDWVLNENLPMERLPRYDRLVSAQWVNDLVSGRKPPTWNNDRYLVVHAHYLNRDAYLSGHIPGAIDMDTLALEAPETWNRRPAGEIKRALEEHGITSDTTVVLYGKFMFPDNNDPFPGSAAGDIGALRLAFIMIYAGVKDVRVLNGGFQAWSDAGFEVSYSDQPKKPVAEFGAPVPALPELAVDTPQAKNMLKSGDAELVCVRSRREYIGEESGYHYIEPKGRIPGAIFADCGSDAYHMENYRNFDNTIREYHETEEIWRMNGITPDKHLAFYCGTGWRGSEAWFNAWLMGWPRVSVYDGGWFEWSADPENPVETGIPEHALSGWK